MEKINPWIDQNEQKHSAVRGFGLILDPDPEPTNITINNQRVPGAVLRLQIPRKFLISNIAIVA